MALAVNWSSRNSLVWFRVNSFTAPACKTDASAKSIFSGPIIHLLSVLCVLMEILSHAGAEKEDKKVSGFKISYFYWSFSGDTMAVKGLIITTIIRNIYTAPNPTRLAQSTSQFKTRTNITIKTRNMHTPDDPAPTAKPRQTCTHPRTVNAVKTCSAAIHGPWTHLVIPNQMQRASQ